MEYRKREAELEGCGPECQAEPSLELEEEEEANALMFEGEEEGR